jgi:hypothetical protein
LGTSRAGRCGDRVWSTSIPFFKKFSIIERVSLQLRAEAFNIFNHSNFFYPNQIVFAGNSASYGYSDSAGQITAATSRQIQLALKLLF